MNHYTILDDDYFEKNILSYKCEVLLWSVRAVWKFEEEDGPTTMNINTPLTRYRDTWYWCEVTRYLGYRIGDNIFDGTNKKNLLLTEEPLNNNFDINSRVTLYVNVSDYGVFVGYLHKLLKEDD